MSNASEEGLRRDSLKLEGAPDPQPSMERASAGSPRASTREGGKLVAAAAGASGSIDKYSFLETLRLRRAWALINFASSCGGRAVLETFGGGDLIRGIRD